MSRQRVLMFSFVVLLAALSRAQTFTTLYNFTGGSDGSGPQTGVTLVAGNLYGTTLYGGSGYGVVYKLDTAGTETVVYSFLGPYSDGANPIATMVRDSKGNFYGTTTAGGIYSGGTVFKIDSAGTETILHNFGRGVDGGLPYQGVIRDKSGSLYGTTYNGGSSNLGVIFKIDRAGNETILHNFAGGSSDGANPTFGHLIMDKAGNLYGVTEVGGANNDGVLYRLSKRRTLTVLHSFNNSSTDGAYPLGTVLRDSKGALYGTANLGGSGGGGIVFKIDTAGNETILHNFAGGTSDGCGPEASVVRDSKGNLYGDTYGCGANNYGTVYKLSARGTLTLLHSFASTDGSLPYGEVWRTAKGELFGTTYQGGTDGYGTVWSYVP